MKDRFTMFSFTFFFIVFSMSIFLGCGDAEDTKEAKEPLNLVLQDTDIDVPQDWFLTKDPELFVKYYRAVLLERFGDIPQVHIVVEDERRQRLGLPQTVDDLIIYLEALYFLFPTDNTLHSLENARKLKEENPQVNIINLDAPDEVIIKQLMEQWNLNRPEAKEMLKKIREQQEGQKNAVEEVENEK